jgi:hypothetical protein
MESGRYAGNPDVGCVFVEHPRQPIASIAISETCFTNVSIVRTGPNELR